MPEEDPYEGSLQRDAERGTKIVTFQVPGGRPDEICVMPKHLPFADYRGKDGAKDIADETTLGEWLRAQSPEPTPYLEKTQHLQTLASRTREMVMDALLIRDDSPLSDGYPKRSQDGVTSGQQLPDHRRTRSAREVGSS